MLIKNKGDNMNAKLAEFIKKKVDRKISKSTKTKANVISDLGITTQYLHDLENGKRTPSPDLMKKMIAVLNLNEKEQIQLYDLVCDCHKSKKIPADIEEYIISNEDAKEKIRKIIYENKSGEVK